MNTFKITFFDKELDIVNVATYHNVIDQSAMLDNIAVQIVTLDLHEAVKAEANGESYTKAVNDLIKPRIESIREFDK